MKKTLYTFSVQEAEEKLKSFIEEDEGDCEVKIDDESKPFIDNRLKLLTTLDLGETNGEETIYQAKDVFKSYIDNDFKNWNLDNEQKPTKKTKVNVYELIKDSTMKEIFYDLENMVMTQSQIIKFCEKHPTWLRQDGYTTLFLIRENDEYFVVYVDVRSGGLYVNVYRLGYVNVWYAEYRYRFVSPQLIA